MVLDPYTAGSAIQSGAGLIQSIIQGAQTRKNLRQQAQHNRELARFQYQQDLDMWNRMNQYNSPAAQMARFKEAGLSPHLIYGRGSSGNAQTMPKYQQQAVDYMQQGPRVDVKPLANVLSQYYSLKHQKAKVDQEEARAKEAKWRTDKTSKTVVVTYNETTGKPELEIMERAPFMLEFQNKLDQAAAAVGLSNVNIRKVKQETRNLRVDKVTKEMLQIGIKSENQYKAFRARMADMNLETSDRLEYRLAFNMLKRNGINPTNNLGVLTGVALYETMKQFNFGAILRTVGKRSPGKVPTPPKQRPKLSRTVERTSKSKSGRTTTRSRKFIYDQ